MAGQDNPKENANHLKRYVRAVGPRLRVLLRLLLALVAVLAANSLYLVAITFLEWWKADPNQTYQNWFYMVMFGAHLGLGLLLVASGADFRRDAHEEFALPPEPPRGQGRLLAVCCGAGGADHGVAADASGHFPVQEPWA